MVLPTQSRHLLLGEEAALKTTDVPHAILIRRPRRGEFDLEPFGRRDGDSSHTEPDHRQKVVDVQGNAPRSGDTDQLYCQSKLSERFSDFGSNVLIIKMDGKTQ